MGACLQVFADLRCIKMQATLAGNKRWEKSQPFIIFPQIRGGNEYGCPSALGEGNSGADEVPKGCVWTVPELFSWVAAMEHVGNTCKHKGTHKYKHAHTNTRVIASARKETRMCT